MINRKVAMRLLIPAAAFVCAACSTYHAGFDAYGYLSPNPDAVGDLIGHFESQAECEAAANAWTSQQVVGNPVRAECYPVDRR